jgi:multiple sugar transport system ATP-binding protein
MAEVILDRVDKLYPGNVKAVTDFNLQIRDGEFVVLVGPSGCGKSTTLRMVAGLEEITQGTIRIGNRVVNDVPPKDRDIAMVFQNYALYPHMTVYDNMAFGLKLRKFPKKEIEGRIQEAAKILGLSELLARRPKALSGGQRQRVAVGRAIVRKPAVFLFDEPLSNLDAKLRVQMRVEISRLHKQLGATMIYVTHDQIEAMTMGERIVVMKDGFIQQVADPITLYDCPANRFVAGFIGTPPMNFFEGQIRRADGGLVFQSAAGFTLPLPEKQKATMARYVDKPVTLGLRPEDIGSAAAEHLASSPHIPSVIDVVEPMGSESYVYFRVGDVTFISRVDAHQHYRVGDQASPAVYIDKAHFFDPAIEKRIA